MSKELKLKKALPIDRSYQQVRNHYIVEKNIANRIKIATREERKAIYATMYDELFSKVPDHPRLWKRSNRELTLKVNKTKLAAIKKFFKKSIVYLEFAPGDCEFAIEVSPLVNFVFGVDISDQRSETFVSPQNFKLIIYDGYELKQVAPGSIDLIFSDQLIEHFHPDDTHLHFQLAYNLLRDGGCYIFQTPHDLLGPMDVSGYFSDKPEGFHLKEWTYIELYRLLKKLHFSKIQAQWVSKGKKFRLPIFYFFLLEIVFGIFPKRIIRKPLKLLMPRISIIATK